MDAFECEDEGCTSTIQKACEHLCRHKKGEVERDFVTLNMCAPVHYQEHPEARHVQDRVTHYIAPYDQHHRQPLINQLHHSCYQRLIKIIRTNTIKEDRVRALPHNHEWQ